MNQCHSLYLWEKPETQFVISNKSMENGTFHPNVFCLLIKSTTKCINFETVVLVVVVSHAFISNTYTDGTHPEHTSINFYRRRSHGGNKKKCICCLVPLGAALTTDFEK